MRHSAGLVAIVASISIAFVMMGSTHAAAQTRCETRRQSCNSECYARYFVIDPKRSECISRCIAEEEKCKREQASHQTRTYASSYSSVFCDAASLPTIAP